MDARWLNGPCPEVIQHDLIWQSSEKMIEEWGPGLMGGGEKGGGGFQGSPAAAGLPAEHRFEQGGGGGAADRAPADLPAGQMEQHEQPAGREQE